MKPEEWCATKLGKRRGRTLRMKEAFFEWSMQRFAPVRKKLKMLKSSVKTNSRKKETG